MQETSKNVEAEEVLRDRVWAFLYDKEFGPCRAVSPPSDCVFTGGWANRTLLQCSCGALLPPNHQEEESKEEQEEEEETEDEEEEAEEEEEEPQQEQEEKKEVTEKKKKKPRFATIPERKEGYFEARTLRSLCLVAVVDCVDRWIQQNLPQHLFVKPPEQQNKEQEAAEESNDKKPLTLGSRTTKATNHKTYMQTLNDNVEVFIAKTLQQHSLKEENASASSSSAATTWLHAIPTDLLTDMVGLPLSLLRKLPTQHAPRQHVQRCVGDCGYWKALYNDRSFAKLLEDIAEGIGFSTYNDELEPWHSWIANPGFASYSPSSSSASCWRLIGKESIETYHQNGEEDSQHIDGIGVMRALCYSSKEAASRFWKKLLKERGNYWTWDSCGAFSAEPAPFEIAQDHKEETDEIASLVIQTTKASLLFVTLVSVGWHGCWDKFLVGVSPLSGRLVGIRSSLWG